MTDTPKKDVRNLVFASLETRSISLLFCSSCTIYQQDYCLCLLVIIEKNIIQVGEFVNTKLKHQTKKIK